MARQTDPRLWIQQAGLLTSIPFVLLVGPLAGYYLGSMADSRWHMSPWGMVVAITAGFVSSFRVTFDLIRQARDLQQQAERDSKRN